MRILQVITAFQMGGGETIGVSLAAGLSERGHTVSVATVVRQTASEVGDEMKSRLDKAKVQWVELGWSGNRPSAMIAPLRLAWLCSRWQPDIVHAHTDIPDFVVSLAGRLTAMRQARTIHNTELWSVHRRIGRIVESGFRDDLIAYISEDTGEAYRALRSHYRLPVSRWQRKIPNGVTLPPESLPNRRADIVREIGADANRRLFCFAGRLTYQKGVDILLDSLTRLPSHQIDSLQLHVFGDGEDRERLQTTAAQRRLPVVFHPPVRGVARLFPAFDCVLLPSRFEGLPIVALESLAAGVPVIGSDAKGLREALPEHWPLVAPVEDAAGLARLLTRVVTGTIDLSRLGKVGQKWARANFRVDDMIGNYAEAYQHFLREKKSAHPEQA